MITSIFYFVILVMAVTVNVLPVNEHVAVHLAHSVDIHNTPISSVTDQFVDHMYSQQMASILAVMYCQ